MPSIRDVDDLEPARPGARQERAAWLVVALVLAVLLLRLVAPVASGEVDLWTDLSHDRHRHLVEAQRLAADARDGDPAGWLRDVERLRLYPPLHAVLASLAMLASGMDVRAAIAPSAVGAWLVGLMVFALAWRLAPSARLSGATIALAFAIASPALRAYATEVMLESLGAGLTLAGLFAYVVAAQQRSVFAARMLGLALTLLLLFKYSFWVLLVVGLGVGVLVERPEPLPPLRDGIAALRRLARREARVPWTWLSAALLVGALIVTRTGGGEVSLLGRRVSVTSPHHLLQLAFLPVLLRLVRWSWRSRRGRGAAIEPRLRALITWHVLPAAAFLALPRRLGYLLRHVGLSNHQGDGVDPIDALRVYGSAWLDAYHPAPAVGLLAVGLALVALRDPRRPGLVGVAVFLVASGGLTLLHPNHQPRYLHSWLPAVWALAGAGAATVLGAPGPRWRRGVAAPIALVGLGAAVLAPATPVRPGVRVRELTDAYLPRLPPDAGIAFLANRPIHYVVEWTFVERYGDRARIELPLRNPSGDPAEGRTRFARWLDSTRADLVVAIDIPDGSPFAIPAPLAQGDALDRLSEQSRFVRVPERQVGVRGARVELWQRGAPDRPAEAGQGVRGPPRP